MSKGYAWAILPMFVFIKHTNGNKEFILGWLNKTINLTYKGNK